MEKQRCVGIWIRVSTEDQARGESPDNHLRRAKAYAEAKDWNVTEVFDLSGVSGKSVFNHVECERMLASIKSGKIDALIFSKLARLARNTRELLDFSDIFKECDADLISLSESIDTSTPAGRLFFTMIAAMAQWEREEITARIVESIPIRAKQGRHLSGAAPFGYRWDNHVLHLEETEAPIRALMFELFLQEKRFRTVARMMNERGYRTRKGNEFKDNFIKRMLTDPMAKGLRRSNYTRKSGKTDAERTKPEDEWEWHECPAIVDVETWDKANALINIRSDPNKRPGRKTVRLFSGIVRCHCDEKMYVRSKMKKYGCSKCGNKIPVRDLEAIFVEQLKNFFFDEDEIANYMTAFDSQFREHELQLASLESKSKKVVQKMERLFDLHEKGELPTKGFGGHYKPLEEQLDQIDNEIPRLQAKMDVQRIGHQNRDHVIHEARDLYSRWSELDRPTKREIIEAITETIVIGEEDIEIRLNYIPEGQPPPFEAPLSTALPPPQSGRERATNLHGFIAEISWNLAGYFTCRLAREMTASPASIG